MVGRPPLGIGQHGEIGIVHRGGKLYARAAVRLSNGKTRTVEAQGPSKAAAKRNLLAKLGDGKAASGQDGINAASRIDDLAALWRERLDRRVASAAMSPNSRRLYCLTWDNHLRLRVGQMQLAELTVQRAERVLFDIADDAGSDTAKTARVVLTALMGMAVKYEAVPHNVVKDADPIPAARRDPPKALDGDQLAEMLLRLSMNTRARRRDIPDFVMWLLATSERIGNGLAASWDRIDLGAAEADLGPNVIRVAGQGLVIRDELESTKTRQRTVGLPATAVRMLRARWAVYGDDPTGLVFPNSRSTGPLDPSNMSKWIREAMNDIDFGWVTSHVFRKTVATTLDEARMTPRQISDRLGHSRTELTQNVYMRRRADSPEVTAALEAMLSGASSGKVTELRPREDRAGAG